MQVHSLFRTGCPTLFPAADLKSALSVQTLAIARLETQRDLLVRECEGYQASYARATQQITDLQRRLSDSEAKQDIRSRRHQNDGGQQSVDVIHRQMGTGHNVPPQPDLNVYDEYNVLSSRRSSSLPFSRSTSASSLSQSGRDPESGRNKGSEFKRMDSTASRFTEKMNLQMSKGEKSGSRGTHEEGGLKKHDRDAYIDDNGRGSDGRVLDVSTSFVRDQSARRDVERHLGSFHDIGSTEEVASPLPPEPEPVSSLDVQDDLVSDVAMHEPSILSDSFNASQSNLQDFIVHEVARSVVSLIGGADSKHVSRAASIHSRRPSTRSRTREASQERFVSPHSDAPSGSMLQLAPDPGPRLSTINVRPGSKPETPATSMDNTASPLSPASSQKSSLLRSRSRSQPHSLSRSTSHLSQDRKVESPAPSLRPAKTTTPPPRSPYTRTPSPKSSRHHSPDLSRSVSIESFQSLSASESELDTPTRPLSFRSSSYVPSAVLPKPASVSESPAPAGKDETQDHPAVSREEIVADEREEEVRFICSQLHPN